VVTQPDSRISGTSRRIVNPPSRSSCISGIVSAFASAAAAFLTAMVPCFACAASSRLSEDLTPDIGADYAKNPFEIYGVMWVKTQLTII
jgi:hypothetical protein